VICRANFIHLQAGPLFTPWTRTFDILSLTQSIRNSRPSFTMTIRFSDSHLKSLKPSPK
jgi:hypothetical protein